MSIPDNCTALYSTTVLYSVQFLLCTIWDTTEDELTQKFHNNKKKEDLYPLQNTDKSEDIDSEKCFN